jgi:hypothetical protein
VANLFWRQDAIRQSKNFLFNRGVAHRVFYASRRMLDKNHKPLCILQCDRDARLNFANCRVNRWIYPPAQLACNGSAHSLITELALTGRAFDKRHRGRVIALNLPSRPDVGSLIPVSIMTRGLTSTSMRSIASGVSRWALRSCKHPSITGWTTRPQAKGL